MEDKIAQAGIQRLDRAVDEIEKLIIVHYSCGLFGTDHREPTAVNHICIKEKWTGSCKTFGTPVSTEIVGLEAFSSYVGEHPDHLWLHWNMRSEQYGFDAIARRHEYLGGTPKLVSTDKRIDLSDMLTSIYGKDYVKHKRFPNLIQLNNITDIGLLSGDEAARAFEKGQFETLNTSTLRKVEAMDAVFQLASGRRLRTNNVVAHSKNESDKPAHQPGVEQTKSPGSKLRPKPTVNERMKAELASNLQAVKGWTAQRWANHLGCAKSTVIETQTWKSLNLIRQQARVEKRNDRRRNMKPMHRSDG
jgi:hypothetical protein